MLPYGTKIVAGSFVISGVVHFAAPQVFGPLVPRELGDYRPWVYASGGVELVCAAGLVTRQNWAPVATAVTLAGLTIGNAQMLRLWHKQERPKWQQAIAAARLPLQVPLIKWALESPTKNGNSAAAVT